MYTFCFYFLKFDFTCLFLLLLDFLLYFFQLQLDNYTFWDARIVPLYCTFTPCSIIFSITFFLSFCFAKLYKVHKFEKTRKFKLWQNFPIYIIQHHSKLCVQWRRKTNEQILQTFTNSSCVIMISTFNDVLTLRVCDFGAPKQVMDGTPPGRFVVKGSFLNKFKTDTPSSAPLVVSSANDSLKVSDFFSIECKNIFFIK